MLLQSRGWDMAAFQATIHVTVYSGCPILPHHMMLPTPETLGTARTYPHQGGGVLQIVHALDDGDVPYARHEVPTERRPAQTVESPYLPTHRAILIRPRSHEL